MAALYLQNKLELLAWGDAGYVFRVTDDIVLKHSIEKNEPRIKNENRLFDILEHHPLCPDVVRSFLRLPDANFLQFLTGGTLEARLRARQVRDSTTRRVLEMEGEEPEHLVSRWMAQLSNAAAWLESHGFAHGDIRPPNLLLDGEDHLKLVDFDNTARVGIEVEVGTAPYARVLGKEGGDDKRSFGLLGPRTEQFAIGSVFYYMAHGCEPYDDEWFGVDHGPVTVDLLENMQFPRTDDSRKGTIIRKCWHGEFSSIRSLADEMKLLAIKDDCGGNLMTQEFYQARRKECEQLVATGLLQIAGSDSANHCS